MIGGHPGADDDQLGRLERLGWVAAEDEAHPFPRERPRLREETIGRPTVRAGDVGSEGPQEPARRHAAPGQAHHGHRPPGERLRQGRPRAAWRSVGPVRSSVIVVI